jgi:dsDNA-specific endonuclease/ATPase MutS2
MTFAPGDQVQVASLGKGTVRDVRNGGRYLVDVKGRSIVVAGSQLELVPATRRSSQFRKSVAVSDSSVGDEVPAAPGRELSLDLHGKTVQEALDALDEFLNAALLAGAAGVRVIHGRSGGRVKAAVHDRLKRIESVRAFRLDERNAGVTIVEF